MVQSKAKSKPKFLVRTNKKTKLSIQIAQKVADLIEEYRVFHKEMSGEDVSVDALVSAVISSALVSDKTFTKWRRDKKNERQESKNMIASEI